MSAITIKKTRNKNEWKVYAENGTKLLSVFDNLKAAKEVVKRLKQLSKPTKVPKEKKVKVQKQRGARGGRISKGTSSDDKAAQLRTEVEMLKQELKKQQTTPNIIPDKIKSFQEKVQEYADIRGLNISEATNELREKYENESDYPGLLELIVYANAPANVSEKRVSDTLNRVLSELKPSNSKVKKEEYTRIVERFTRENPDKFYKEGFTPVFPDSLETPISIEAQRKKLNEYLINTEYLNVEDARKLSDKLISEYMRGEKLPAKERNALLLQKAAEEAQVYSSPMLIEDDTGLQDDSEVRSGITGALKRITKPLRRNEQKFQMLPDGTVRDTDDTPELVEQVLLQALDDDAGFNVQNYDDAMIKQILRENNNDIQRSARQLVDISNASPTKQPLDDMDIFIDDSSDMIVSKPKKFKPKKSQPMMMEDSDLNLKLNDVADKAGVDENIQMSLDDVPPPSSVVSLFSQPRSLPVGIQPVVAQTDSMSSEVNVIPQSTTVFPDFLTSDPIVSQPVETSSDVLFSVDSQNLTVPTVSIEPPLKKTRGRPKKITMKIQESPSVVDDVSQQEISNLAPHEGVEQNRKTKRNQKSSGSVIPLVLESSVLPTTFQGISDTTQSIQEPTNAIPVLSFPFSEPVSSSQPFGMQSLMRVIDSYENPSKYPRVEGVSSTAQQSRERLEQIRSQQGQNPLLMDSSQPPSEQLFGTD